MMQSWSGARMLRRVCLLPDHRTGQYMAMPVPSQPARRRWSASEVRQLIAETALASPRYELVDGELLVTPSPSGAHQAAVAILLRELERYLVRHPLGRARTSPFDVELEPGSIVQPDVFVLPLSEARRVLQELPARELLLAAEVISPSSARHDRMTKRPVFQRHVSEYWIVDLDARLFERWRPGDDRPEIVATTLAWQPPGAAEPFALDVERYFAELFEEL